MPDVPTAIHVYMCSDRTNWYMYFRYCYGGGNYILYAKPIVDSGPGSPSDRALSSEETAFMGGGLLRWQIETGSWAFVLVE